MNEYIERLGWVLVHSLWQFALFALLAGATVRGLRRSSASLRYVVLVAALAVTVIAPVVTWMLQQDDSRGGLAIRDASASESTSVVLPEPPVDNALLTSGSMSPSDTQIEEPAAEITETSPVAEIPRKASQPVPAQPDMTWSERTASLLRPWLAWIVTVWSLGVLIWSLRPLLGWHTLRRLKRVGVSPAADDILAVMKRVSVQFGLNRTVQVMQSTLAQVPIVVGYFKPVILLPISLVTSIPAEQLEAILAHELAHVRRHDFVVNLLQTLVETVFFYHPAVWWISRQIRVEREHCCDDLVIALLGNRVEYGRALVAIEELRGRSSVLALGVADGSLLSRVRRIAGFRSNPTSTRLGELVLVSIVCLVALGVVLPIAFGTFQEPVRLDAWGPASNGLQCRLLPVPATADDEAPDLSQTTNQFVGADDVTFAVELKNVSDRPQTLLGVRYSFPGNPYDGKLHTEFYAPELFEFEFTAADGKPVPRTSRVIVGGYFILNSASAHEIAPGKSLVVLLRPAKFETPTDHRLPPGSYRAKIRYRGPDAGTRVYFHRNFPNDPKDRAWSGEVTSNEVAFTVANDPAAPKPAQLVWGPVKDGLQAAVEFRPMRGIASPDDPLGTFPAKPPVAPIFHVKNVSNRAITFVSERGRQGDEITATNAAGEAQRLASPFFTGISIVYRWTLKPGEVAELHAAGGIGLIEQPGKYTIRCQINFANLSRNNGEGDDGFPKKDDWQQILVTGDTPIVIRERTPADDVREKQALMPKAAADPPSTATALPAPDVGGGAGQAPAIPEADLEKLLDQLASAELPSLDVMSGGGIFRQTNSVPQALYVTLWGQQHGDVSKFDPRVGRLIELGPQVAPAVNRRLAKANPGSSLAAHLAAVLRTAGNEDSVPVLIDLLKRGTDQDKPTNTVTIGFAFSMSTEFAATSALWTLTGRQQLFTPQQWAEWWNSVKADFVVHRDRQRPDVMARVTPERVRRLVPELAQREEIARERLIVLGPAAIPPLLMALQSELKERPADALSKPDSPRTLAQRLAWVIDELGATDKLPPELLREYFTRRFADLGDYVGSFPIEEQAVCRALSHCSFADFCRICLAADGQQGLRLCGWMHLNTQVFSRRFAKKPQFVTGDPSQTPLWNNVTPASDPAAEIAAAVPVIVTAIRDKAPLVRSCAAKLADVIGFASVERPEPLIVALRDAWLTEGEANLRLDIGLAMARFSTPLVVKAISDGLRSERLEIVSDSAGLMDWVRIELNDQTRADFELLVELTHHENDQLRRRAARSLSGKAPQLLEPELERLAADRNDEIRQIVTLTLRSNPDPKFADVLFKLAADTNEQVRINALSSISNLKHPASMPRLVPFLRDKKVHGYAVSALADMGGRDALPLLMTELKSGNDVGGMIYQHLRRLTGEKFEEKPEPWLEWWNEKIEKAVPAAQGSILSIDPERKLVVISLGANDGVRPRTIFHVREPGSAKKRQQPAAVKGKIEVTEIISENTAEARILEERLNNGLVKGDRVVLLDAAAGDEPAAAASPIRVQLKLNRQEYLLGESIAVEYEMTNDGQVDVPYGKGGFFPDLRINDGFRMSAVRVDENGKPVADSVANWPMPENFEGKAGGFQLQPGEKYSTTLFVTRYLRFLETGRYRLRIENVDRLDPSNTYSFGETFLTLKQPTPKEARGVFDRMKKAPRQAYDDNAMKFLPDAADFQAMHHPVYLPILREHALENDLDVLQSLERMESVAANEVLIEAMGGALGRDDWRMARACFQSLKVCLPFPNWYNEPWNDHDQPNRDRVIRTWKPGFGPMLTRLAKRLNAEVAARMRERESEPLDADASDPEFLKAFRHGYFPQEHPQSLLIDIDYIYRCVGQPQDFADCLRAFAHSIELTKSLPLETHQYFRPHGSASGFRHAVMYMLQRGAKVPEKPSHPGEAAALAIAVRTQPDFRPDGWQSVLTKWLKGFEKTASDRARDVNEVDWPYLAELILDYFPEPMPNEVLDYLPTALAHDYVDLQIAACHVAQKHPRAAYREPLQKILDTAKDQYLRKFAVDAARANGLKAKYDANAPFVDAAAENAKEQETEKEKEKADRAATKPDPGAATAPPKGLEFLEPYPKLHGLSLNMTEAQFRALAAKGNLNLQLSPRDGDSSRYAIPTGDGQTVLVMFKSGKCSGIQRIRGEERVDKVSFESVSVSFLRAPLSNRQAEQIQIKADGSCVYHIDEDPAVGNEPKKPEARLISKLGPQRMLELERLLAKTDWLTAEGGEGPATHTDAGEVKITVVRNKQIKTISCLGMRQEPYNSLLWHFRGIAEQEHLVYVFDWLHGSDTNRKLALIQIRFDIEGLSGIRGPGLPYLELDYNRFLPTFSRMVRNPSTVEDEVLTAIKLVTFVRAEAEIEWVARLKHDRDSRIREAVAEALGDFGGERVVPTLVEMAPNTAEARWGLIRLGEIAVPSLVKLIEPGIIRQDFTSEHVVRAFIDHQKELRGPIDVRIIMAARQALAKTAERHERTEYFKEFLKLSDQKSSPSLPGASSPSGTSAPKTAPNSEAAPQAGPQAKSHEERPKAGPLVAPSNSSWVSFRHDHAQTGVARTLLAEKLELWWETSLGGQVTGTAAIVGDFVYVPCESGELICLDKRTGRRLWAYRSARDLDPKAYAPAFKSSPTVTADAIYLGDEEGVFHAIDRTTGTRRWTFETENQITSSAAVVGGKVLFGSYDNHVYCLHEKDGTSAWKFATQSNVHAALTAVGGNVVIAGCDGHLRIIDIAAGTQKADIALGNLLITSPVVIGDVAYVGTFDNEVLSVNLKTNDVAWRYSPGHKEFSFLSSPAVTDKLVVIGARDKKVHAIDQSNGKPAWTFATAAKVDSSPVVVGRRVFIGSDDGNLYELDLATGVERWRFRLGSPISASPAIGEGVLVIGSEDAKGKVVCFGGAAAAPKPAETPVGATDSKPGAPAYVLPDHLNVMAIGFEPDGRALVTVSTESDVRIRKWDTGEKKLVRDVKLAHDKHTNSFLSGRLMMSDDCQRVIGTLDGQVGIWNAATGAVIRMLTLPPELRPISLGGLACTPDLTLIACGSTPGRSGFGPPDAQAVVWNASTGNVVRTVTHTNSVQVHCVALSPDGKRLSTGCQQAGTCVWDVGTGERLLDLPNSNPGRRHPDESISETGADQVLCLRFSPDGKWLAIGDMLGVKLVNWQTGQLVHQFEAPFRFGRSGLVFSHNGLQLARTATDKVVPIWSTQTGKLLAELGTEAHDGAFSPDGNSFAAAFTDFKQAVAVWPLRDNDAEGRPSGSTATTKSADANGEIVGRLVDEKGNPVAGATIACGAVINDSGQGGGANAVTDADGRYRLVPPSPGIYNVWLKKYEGDRRLTAMADDGLLVEAGQVATSQMRLMIGHKVAGRLVDVDGTPEAGRGIGCSSTARPESAATIESLKTNDDGSFEFFLPPGRAHLYVNDRGIGATLGASATIDVSPYRDVPLVTLTLKPRESKFGSDEWLQRSTKGTRIVRHENAKNVTGIVVDAANQPISGAKVIRVDGPIATANEKGEFLVEIAKGTQFIMYAFQPGYHVWFGTPTAGDVLTIVLEKKETGRGVPGTRTSLLRFVGGYQQEPLAGVQVEITNGYGDTQKKFGPFTTDEKGTIQVGLQVAFYHLHLKSDKELPYLPVEELWNKESRGPSPDLSLNVTETGVEKWLGGKRRDEGYAPPAEPAGLARVTYTLLSACELVLRAIDAETGKGLPGAEFYEENAVGEEWAHPIDGENLGSKFIDDGRAPVPADANLTDQDGNFKRLVGANANFLYGVGKAPAGYEVIEPGGEVEVPIVYGQRRAEHVFKFRRIKQNALSLKGRVSVKGPIPDVPPMTVRKAVAVEIPDDSLVIGKEGGIANVAIYLKRAPRDWTSSEETHDVFEMRSADHRFQPRMSFVRVGQPIRLIAPKGEAEHFSTQPLRSNPFSILVPHDSTRDIAEPFNKSERSPIPVTSNIHSWQKAWLLALDHPFAAITDAEGRFEIRDLPAGEHHFIVWHERRGFLDKDLVVRIKKGKAAELDLQYTAEQLRRD